MTDARRALGRAGEAAAAAFLEAKGYVILERNLRTRHGELDLVARAPDGTLTFIEVRTRRGAEEGAAAASVDARKQPRVRELAGEYLAARAPDADARIDVITVALAGDGRRRIVEQIENAVEG